MKGKETDYIKRTFGDNTFLIAKRNKTDGLYYIIHDTMFPELVSNFSSETIKLTRLSTDRYITKEEAFIELL